MKKKVIFGSLLAVTMVMSLVFKTKNDSNLQQATVGGGLWFLLSWTEDFTLSTQNCVCKGGSCSEANWVSFRESCGSTTGGQSGNTNAACSISTQAGNCN